MQWSTRVQNKGRLRAQGLKAEELQGGIVVLLLHVISFSRTSRHFLCSIFISKKYFNFKAFKHCKKNAMCLEGRDEFYFNLLLNPEIKAISQTPTAEPTSAQPGFGSHEVIFVRCRGATGYEAL